MEKATREYLAKVAGEMALTPFHGALGGLASNLAPIVRPFPTWSVKEADGLWCAAFVYYCCREAGFEIPYRPKECRTCHLAACLGWEEFAAGDRQIEYDRGTAAFAPDAGDIVIYDRVFENHKHDHIHLLQRRQKEQEAEQAVAGVAWSNPNRLVFTNGLGGHLVHITVYKEFKEIARTLGYENARFHDLRHSYDVAAIESGDDIKTVQANLGHATASFTLDVYGHASQKMRQRSADRMEQYIKDVLWN